MIKKIIQELKITNNENAIRNELNKNKSNNSTTVGVAYYATRNAITLIALVITIIVLLILVGVTLSLILRGSLLQKAEDATGWYKDAQTNEISDLENVVAKIDNINGGEDTGSTYDMVEGVPVPKGFTHIEGTKETGFVIRNDEDLNEFVWIPTDLVEYKTYDWNKGNAATVFTEYYTSDEEENERIIEEVTNSVRDHKGYYISRYEAGVTTKRTSKTTNQADLPAPVFRATSTTTPVYAYNYVNWSDAIYIGNNLYNKTNHNVTSRLINARGWDTALKFIETVGADKDATYPTNSEGKGWYSDNKSNNANYETGKSVDITNATVPNRLKNIYDMAGNMWEWTADIFTSIATGRAIRRWRLPLYSVRCSSSLP